eukprot:CAMPEP_0119345594 /NCGR_PEP_ID=MMETSP1333-20130426/107569_1 /TAXON_ID=418940 /ORGANISM="Scyphosphaera apsteinii, Strain RCC1455" /LENGTH=34 /DNA_ID= /DNA_START= /DNA_END= /DNA_ORIENTATION=
MDQARKTQEGQRIGRAVMVPPQHQMNLVLTDLES